MKFTFTVSKEEIDKAYKQVVNQAIKNTTIKGFRKGQAPENLVVQQIGQSNLQRQAVEEAIPEAFSREVTKRDLKLISYPNIQLKKGVAGEDFEFEAEVATAPEIKLNNYKEALKGTLKKNAIWTPEKGAPEDQKHQQPSEEEQLTAIFDQLLKTIELEVPELLVNQEVNRMLSRLVNQIDQLGLNMEDYLTSMNETKESIRQKYAQTATDRLKLELILQEIAKDLAIKVEPQEMDAFIKAVPDEKSRKIITESSQERANIELMLVKQKTIQELKKLAA